MTDLFYTGSKRFKIGDPIITQYMCCGQRDRGKTSNWLKVCGERALNEALEKPEKINHKFIFLRRSEKQLEKVISKGLFNGVWNIPNAQTDFHGYTVERIHKGVIYLSNGKDEYPVGYTLDLNNVKGQSIEDADVLIFDEYVEANRSDYKGGNGGVDEPELFARLLETVFRFRTFWVIMLGNFDSPTNPYNEYFNIPYGVNKYTDKKRGIYYEVDYSPETEKFKNTTSIGRLFAETEYSRYSNGNVALGSVDGDLICNKPKNAEHRYNVNVCGQHLTFWTDENTGVWFIHDNYAFDKNKPIYAVMSKDMVVNGMFISYNSIFLNLFKLRFASGMVRFNSQKTASLFNLVINLVK